MQLVRDKEDMFWAIMFPILLATFMYLAFGQLFSSEKLEKLIPVAVVVESENAESENFQLFANEMSDILSVEYVEESEALKLLEEGKIDGVFYTGNGHRLMVVGSNWNTNILQAVLDSYTRNEAMIREIAQSHPERVETAIQNLSEYKSMTEEVTVGGGSLDTSLSYFFAVLGMACMFGCFIGMRCPIDIQANLSALGARRSVTPTHRLKLVIADLTAALTVHFFNVLILLAYMKYILKIEFGDNLGYMTLLCLVGSMVGVALGMFVGSIGKISENGKIAIMITVSLTSSFLSGLMVHSMKSMVEEHAPIINRVNPAALIVDGFYCLNVYDDMRRYWISFVTLVVMAVLLLGGSFVMVRRERYDSI